MQYNESIILKSGAICVLRSGTEADGKAVLDNFNHAHAETDYLVTYPDENNFTAEGEADYLRKKLDSTNEIEIIALVDGKVIGTAGIEAVGTKYKLRHRAEFGISVLKEFWGLGIGRALTNACLKCAEQAGYTQIELTVASENTRAIALYESVGFIEYGRNPRGCKSRISGYQEIVYMRKEI